MNEMKIPYSALELKVALLGIDSKIINDEKDEKFAEKISSFVPKNKNDLNKKIAEYNGVGVMDLINSPNYTILCNEYKEAVVKDLVRKVKDEFNLTSKQAWAFFACSIGLLD